MRPETAHELAHALEGVGRGDEAAIVFKDLARLRPAHGRHWVCLGDLLQERGDPDGAAALERAVAILRAETALNPDDANAHFNLANALSSQGNLPEAIAEYRKVIRLKPEGADAHCNLGNSLNEQGKPDEAIAEYRAAILLKPEFSVARNGLGNALDAQGKPDEAIVEYRTAIQIDPDNAIAHYNLGRGLGAQGKIAEAIAEYGAAVRLRPDSAVAHCNLGLMLSKQGQFREALTELRRGHELGSKRADWPYPSRFWVSRLERMVPLVDRLAAVLRGDLKPNDAREAAGFADLAYESKGFAASARFYAEAFQADPKLAEDIQAQNRYSAACSAALAGAGKGNGKPSLEEPEMARWRKQALDWLRADLAFWTKLAETGKHEAKAVVGQRLWHWRDDSDLAGIRDDAAVKAAFHGRAESLPEPLG